MNWFTKPKPRVSISGKALKSHLRSHLSPWGADFPIYTLDRKYALLRDEEAFQLVRDNQTFWKSETGDCDDSSIMTKAAAIRAAWKGKYGGMPAALGEIVTEDHSLTIYVNEDSRVMFGDRPGEIYTLDRFRAATIRFVRI